MNIVFIILLSFIAVVLIVILLYFVIFKSKSKKSYAPQEYKTFDYEDTGQTDKTQNMDDGFREGMLEFLKQYETPREETHNNFNDDDDDDKWYSTKSFKSSNYSRKKK